MNLLCGFFAILINEPIISFFLLLIGIIFDFFDGFSARLLKVPSVFGKELDSLADMVSFGVVPGFLYYHHVLKGSEEMGFIYVLKLFTATLVPILASLRLAKFNTKDSGKIGFAGLPSSAAALMIISIPFLAAKNNQFMLQLLSYDFFIFGVPILFGLLMVTNLPMFNFKSFKGGIKKNAIQFIYIISLIPVIYSLKWFAIPVSILWYIAFSITTIPFWRK